MRQIYVFNGDADGLCALQQLRLAEPGGEIELISGTKRETALVGAAKAGAGDRVTVLDMSFDSNRAAVERLLALGVRLRYFDHHYAGQLPVHEALDAHIDTSAAVCTSAIVDTHLCGAARKWAIVGAYGDNLDETAERLADLAEVPVALRAVLKRLGVALNYNAYGETEADLLFRPLELHARLVAYRDPVEFATNDPAFVTLWQGYQEDLARTDALEPVIADERAAAYRLPDADWARRVNGVFANRLARAFPERAHAVLLPKTSGALSVSVRAPLRRPAGAAALCRAYAGGGGREGAAGITDLPAAQAEGFVRHFMAHFRG
jgi:hypothetical protein